MSDTVVITVPERRHWQWWRDVVILVLAITVGALAILVLRGQSDVRDLRYALDRSNLAAAEQRETLSAQVVELAEAVRVSDQRIRSRDAEIKRLTDKLLELDIDPGTSLVPASDRATSTPTAGPSGPRPTPAPSPRATSRPPATPRPAPRPTPSPSPTTGPTPLLCALVPLALPGCPPGLRTGPPTRPGR